LDEDKDPCFRSKEKRKKPKKKTSFRKRLREMNGTGREQKKIG